MNAELAHRYLVGELARKTGDKKKALVFLEPLLAERDVPDGLRKWVQEAVAKAKR